VAAGHILLNYLKMIPSSTDNAAAALRWPCQTTLQDKVPMTTLQDKVPRLLPAGRLLLLLLLGSLVAAPCM
jgi:hypothetical protein